MPSVTLEGINNHEKLGHLLASLLPELRIRRFGAMTIAAKSAFVGAMVNVNKKGKVQVGPFGGSPLGGLGVYVGLLIGIGLFGFAIKWGFALSVAYGAVIGGLTLVAGFGLLGLGVLCITKQQQMVKHIIATLEQFKQTGHQELPS